MKKHTLFAALATTLFVGGCSGTLDATNDGMAIADFSITPDKDTLTQGTSLQFHAMLTYADGTEKDVSQDGSTVWNTSNADVATVTDGMVSAVKEGIVDISADFKGVKANEHFAVTP